MLKKLGRWAHNDPAGLFVLALVISLAIYIAARYHPWAY